MGAVATKAAKTWVSPQHGAKTPLKKRWLHGPESTALGFETMAQGRFGQNRNRRPLTAHETNLLAPFEVLPGFLEPERADQLLKTMSNDAKDWVRGTWWVFQRKCTAPRSSAFFDFLEGMVSPTLLGEN